MDITNLSEKTFIAIIDEADSFDEILSEQFEMLCNQCEDEKDFINKALDLAKGLLTYDDDELDELYLGEPPAKTDFHHALKRIVENIEGL